MKRPRWLLWLLPIALLPILSSCGQSSAATQSAKRPVKAKEFSSKSYQISDHERITEARVPHGTYYERCLIYSNDLNHTSNMSCDFGDNAPPEDLREADQPERP
jgi:hypothetical protein